MSCDSAVICHSEPQCYVGAMQLTIKLEPDVARSVRLHDQGMESVRQIFHECARVGGYPVPLVSSEEAGDISLYFIVDIDSQVTPADALSRLLDCPGVEGAYVKTRDEPA